jgi:hypothetical protein
VTILQKLQFYIPVISLYKPGLKLVKFMEADEIEKLKAELFLQEQLYQMEMRREQKFEKLKALRQKMKVLKQALSEDNENSDWRENT